jgi:hypothetical protein
MRNVAGGKKWVVVAEHYKYALLGAFNQLQVGW